MPPRPLRPKNDSSVPEGSDAAGDGKGGKRKAVSSACIPCRKRKSKCDGQLPSCSTCIAVYRTECSYDADTDFKRKGPVKREPQTSPQHDASEVIVSHLKSLPEVDSINLLQILRTEPNLDHVADSLRANRLATLASSRDESPHQYAREQSERQDDALPYLFAEPSASKGAVSWLRIPQDTEFVEHLLELYVCWIQPYYTFVSWDHFIHDLQHSRSDFCSSLLLNAVLSFACHYSDRSAARTNPANSTTAGDHFYAEAKRLLDESDASCLTTVQALGVMSVRETSAGRDSNGYQLAGRCVRMALELGLHLSVIRQGLRAPEAEVRKTTFWAVFNLETMCAVSFGRLSQLPSSSADIEAPTIAPQDELQKWRPYEDTNLSLSATAEQPARSSLFRTQLSKLSLLASDMVNTFYAPRERFTSRRLAATYAQYREWYRDLPDAFRLENTSLPHVLVLHMYYYGCVLHLFRPYIKYDLRAAELFPRDTCTFCANEISALMNALRALYGLRRVTLAVVNLLLSASTIHLLNLPAEPAAAHLSQGLHDLEAISTNHRFAARAVDIIRSLSTKWKISLPKGAAAIAVYRSLEPQQMQYPPESTFFAASIDRKHSSEGRERSGASIQEPFAPPIHRAPGVVRLNSIPSFSSDPATPVDLRQAQNAIWTPFPGQVMPLHLREFTTLMVDFGGMDSQQQPQIQDQVWSQENEMVDETHEYHGGQGPGLGHLDEEMEGVSDWHWRS